MDVCLAHASNVLRMCCQARAIGLIRTSDQDGPDDKVIAVPVSKVDPRFDEIQSIEDLARACS